MLSNSTGKIRCLGVGSLYHRQYTWGGKAPTMAQDYKRLAKENTYVNVFGPGQDDYLNRFLKEPDINILFQSKKAVNTRYREVYTEEDKRWLRGGKDGGLERNTVVVWEFKDVE